MHSSSCTLPHRLSVFVIAARYFFAVEDCRPSADLSSFSLLSNRITSILHDTQLAAGANLLLLLGSANRDPRSIDRPHQFEIRRAGPRHLAFGFGPHFCIGAALTRLIAKDALRELPLRVQWQPLAG